MSVESAITRRSFRQVRLGALAWAIVFGGTVASSALAYVTTFPTAAARAQIAATTGRDVGMSMLLGPISSIDTVGGYTVYKCYVTLTTIGAIWGVLIATRLLRGEEDRGRWQVVLTGSTRASGATMATLAGIGIAIGVVFAGTTIATVLAGADARVRFSVTDSLVYGLSVAIAPAVFAGVGAVTSQLGRSRRLATGLGMVVLGVSFVVRMIADSGPATKWLLWLSPFGWIERMRPITENDLRPLALAAVVAAALFASAALLAARRDAGAGVIADRDVASLRPFGLGSATAFALRLELPVLVAWFAGVAAAGLCFGIIAKVAIGSLPESMGNLLDKFGVQGTFLRQYLSVAFLMMAAIVSLLPANQIGAAAEEETTGRLVHLLAQPSRRTPLFAGRMAIAAVAVAVAGVVAGLSTWAGARLQGVDTGLGLTLQAGANVVPTALLVLGVGAVVRTVAPRQASAAVYGIVAWSFVADLVASLVDATRWMERLSVFHYMALVPADAADPVSVIGMLLVAVALLAVATVLFARRDVGQA